MGLNFGQVVACNNILALRAFSVFLFNYSLHEHPSFIERIAVKAADTWVQKQALLQFKELKQGIKEASIALNECQTGMFTVLYLASQPKLVILSGKDLFGQIAALELEFEKIKKPREESSYFKPE